MSNKIELNYSGKESSDRIIKDTQPANLKVLEAINTGTIANYFEYKDENKLILGDNLQILKSLYNDERIRGKVKLIYIDPPFSTKQKFKTRQDEEAYLDLLVGPDFIEFLRKRLVFLHELLSNDGSIYVHLDQKMGHYMKIVLDEIFGQENFRNDITRIKCNPKNFSRKAYGNTKDVIYFYSKKNHKGDSIIWNDYRTTTDGEELERLFPKIDASGRRYATTPLHAKGETKSGPTGQMWKNLMPPKGRHWRYSPKELTRLDENGLIEWSSTGNPRKIIYAEEHQGKKVQDVWDFRDPGEERGRYPTEKNEELLKLIINNSSNKGDLVLDCFCGSGTTLAVAETLGRKWIGIDNSQLAIDKTKKRLLELDVCSPFTILKS